ncbi:MULTISPECIES: hypothetical protein [Vibrio harveyi group]|nr:MULTISPECIES: hypothetical protein [Vibrio harveyi group]EDP57880.1 hypothetical protein AND4_12302 [Vibrio sp. AND4]
MKVKILINLNNRKGFKLMSCSDLSSVRFGSDSRNAIEEIRELQDMAKALSVFIGASAMLDIFGGNGVIGASYKIYTTDFQLLDQAMRSSNPLLVRRVEDISARMYMKPSLTYQEKMFWRCMYNAMR